MDLGGDLLGRVSIFGGLGPDTLSFLLERAEAVRVSKNDVFFRQGDPGGALYVLKSGRAEVRKSKDGKNEVWIADLHAGDCFGEISPPASEVVRSVAFGRL